jgi:hypothetical protein
MRYKVRSYGEHVEKHIGNKGEISLVKEFIIIFGLG